MMETLRLVLLHFGIAVAMSAGFALEPLLRAVVTRRLSSRRIRPAIWPHVARQCAIGDRGFTALP